MSVFVISPSFASLASPVPAPAEPAIPRVTLGAPACLADCQAATQALADVTTPGETAAPTEAALEWTDLVDLGLLFMPRPAGPSVPTGNPPHEHPAGRPWMALKLGEAVARSLHIPPEGHTPADLVALGEHTLAHHATSGEDLDAAVLVAIAGAAGVLDQASLTEGDADKLAERLDAFVRTEFRDEIALHGALDGLSDARMPMRLQLASELLREAGVDPDHPPTDWVVPMHQFVDAFHPPQGLPRVPTVHLIPSERYLLDHPLSVRDIAKMQTLSGAALTPEQAHDIHARLPESVNAEFDKRFDAYKQTVAGDMSALIRARLALHAKRHDIDLSGATIIVSKPTVEFYRTEVMPLRGSAVVYQGPTRAQVEPNGCFFSIQAGGSEQRFFLSLATGESHVVPPGVDLAQWLEAHPDQVFDAREIESTRGSDTLLRTRFAIQELGRGDGTTLDDKLSGALRNDIERMRETARGQTFPEATREFFLDLIPFRSAIMSIQRGDVPLAIFQAGMDALWVVPLLWSGARLAGAGLKAGAAGLVNTTTQLASPALVRTAARTITSRVGSGLGTRGVTNALARLRDGLRASIWRASKSWGRMASLDPDLIASRLRGKHPAMAYSLQTASRRMRGASIADGWWRVRALPAAQGDDAVGAAATVIAHGQHAGTLPLVQYGRSAAYTQYDTGLAERMGAVLLAGRDGLLYRSLPVNVLERYRVTQASVLQQLETQRMGATGTLSANGETYARIGDDYVQVIVDRATSTTERPIWRAVPPAQVERDTIVHRLAYDAENGIWRQADTPGLHGGGGTLSRGSSAQQAGAVPQAELPSDAVRGSSRSGSSSSSSSAASRPRPVFEDIRYDRPNLRVQPFSDEIQRKYPSLVGGTRRDYFLRGPDGQLRRFPGGYSGGTVTPQLIDSEAIRATERVVDYSHAGALDQVLAGYRYDPARSLATYHAGDMPVSSLTPLRGVYPLRPGLGGQYMIPATAHTDSATACAQMLLAEGKNPAQVAVQLERHDHLRRRYQLPGDPIESAVFQVSAQLKKGAEAIHFNGMRHDDAMAIIKRKLEEDAPVILFRKDQLVVLDAVETDAWGTWLTIRHPVTGSKVRIRDHKEFWRGNDSGLTVTRTEPNLGLHNTGIISIASEYRKAHLRQLAQEAELSA